MPAPKFSLKQRRSQRLPEVMKAEPMVETISNLGSAKDDPIGVTAGGFPLDPDAEELSQGQLICGGLVCRLSAHPFRCPNVYRSLRGILVLNHQGSDS